MDSEQFASLAAVDMEAGKSEALKGTSKDDPDSSPTPPPPSRKEESGKEEWTDTYKPLALGLVAIEMTFLLASLWAASFGEKPQAHWTWVPMLLIQGMTTVSLCLCLFALLSKNMTNEQRSRLVCASVALIMISIILSIISSVVYNRAPHNQG